MNDLNRRKFLALAGVSTAGIAAGGLSVVSGQDKGDKEKLPTKDRSPGEQLHLGGADFEIRIQATGDAEVLAASGLSFGSFSPAVTGGSTAAQWAELDKLDAGASASRKTADVSELLSGLPAPLIPLALHSLTNHNDPESFSVGFLVVPPVEVKGELSSALAVGDDFYDPAWSVGKTVAGYHVRASVHSHYLGSCIRRNVPHVSILVHKVVNGRGVQLFDLHVAAWWEGNRPCFAVYESAKGFCRNSCSYPTWDRISSFINELAAASGVPWWLTWTLATGIAVVAVAGLTVIPGVPPPP